MDIKFIGLTFGNLIVIRRSKKPCAKNNTLWDCKCKICGKTKQYYQGNIKRHNNKCTCSFQKDKHILNQIFTTTRLSAKKRNIKFNKKLTKNKLLEILEKQNYKCALSNLKIQIGRYYKNIETTASIDRIDSSKGYTINNIQWVHKDINKLKNIFNQTKFIQYCKLVAKNN